MRILILGDSLPFPRPNKGQPLPVTWPALLREQYPECDIWLRATPRSCILDVLKEFAFFTDSLAEFDLIVVQTGIVDCAPRPYPRFVYKLIESFCGMPALRRIERFAHARLRWLYGRPWVSSREFAASIRELVETASERHPGIRSAFVPIASPSRTIVQTLPGVDRAAAEYNGTLARTVSDLKSLNAILLDPFAGVDPEVITIEDGHHLSRTGHVCIAAAIGRMITAAEHERPPHAHPSARA